MNVQTKGPIDTDTNRPALITADQLAGDFSYLLSEVAALERQAAESPNVLEDDGDLSDITKVVVDLRDKQKAIKDKKDYEKRPHLDANSVLESFFTGMHTRLVNAQTKLEASVKRYLNKKKAAEEARLLEVARQEREEANRRAAAAAEAAKAQKPVEAAVANQQAQAADMRADAAIQQSQAKPAELARTRTETGTATLQEQWLYQIEAYALIDLDAIRPYLAPADIEKAVRKFVSINKDTKPLAGVRIFRDTKANIR